MEINQIKYTDLTILRKILEGEFDPNLDNCKGFDDKQLSNIDDENQQLKKIKNNSKRKSLKEINSDFYLNENDENLKLWLKKKKKLNRQKRKEMRIEKQGEQMKNELERKRTEERLAFARVAYDNWLKEIRQKTPVRISKDIRSESRNQERKKVADESYNGWLAKKQKIKNKIVNETIPNENQKSEKKLLREDKKSNLQIVPFLINNSTSIRPSTSKRMQSSHRSKSAKLQTEPEKFDEDFQKIIIDLHKTKSKQVELSKKRVDSGIIFQREKKPPIKNLLLKSNDSFQWKLLAEEEEKEEEKGEVIEEITKFKSNSRTRKIDRITHEHKNPFVDKYSEHYFLNKSLQT